MGEKKRELTTYPFFYPPYQELETRNTKSCSHLFLGEPPQIVRTAQKGTYVGKHEVLSGEASRQRRLSSFEQDALMVVEVDIAVNHLVGFRESSWFVAVNALCLED